MAETTTATMKNPLGIMMASSRVYLIAISPGHKVGIP
jgi:hypothetical protein